MKQQVDFIKTPGGVIELTYSTREPLDLRPSHQYLNAQVNILDKSAVDEGAYTPPSHIYFSVDAGKAAELGAAFSALSRKLRGLEA